MDLLTRGAGFGYIGSTVTSLIYASFTFIFFALEAAVMAYALELAFDIPPAWGYLLCALVVIPLVTHGVTAISRLQVWTQPLWLVMLVLPYAFVLQHNPGLLQGLVTYAGEQGQGPGFSLMAFGAAMTTVGIALITQMGEQADYLRFMPPPQPGRAAVKRWWAAVIVGGPGWVVPGVLKMLGGALLAYLALTHMVPSDRAVDPNQMYLAAYETVFPQYGWAVAATAAFVVVSQLKINVTNAYAGSLAWSNFFSRLTHSHPGRVVWMVFNTGIALVLMEMNVFSALGHVLGLYANIAIAWMMAVVADLVVNKPLGLSPPGIEFKRAHLYDINPVGVGAMGIASLLSIVAHLGAFGPLAQAFSALIALVTAFVAVPLIAWATKGRYYLARRTIPHRAGRSPPTAAGTYRPAADLLHLRTRLRSARHGAVPRLPGPDLQPVLHAGRTLRRPVQARCTPVGAVDGRAAPLLPRRMWPQLDAGLAQYLLLMGCWCRAGLLMAVVYTQAARCAAGAAGAAAARRFHRRHAADADRGRHRGLVAGAGAAEPAARRRKNPTARPRRCSARSNRTAAPTNSCRTASAPGRRCRQPGQEPLHHHHQPRAAHAAEQHPGLRAAAGRGRGHARAPAPGGQRDPPRRRPPAGADRRHAGHRAHRAGQADAGSAADALCRRHGRDRAPVRTAGRRARHRLSLHGGRHAAGGGACRREAAAPDPHQPAGQCGEVHRARRRSACVCTTSARWRASRSATPAPA
jgi:purine-cytosine permease-like protein